MTESEESELERNGHGAKPLIPKVVQNAAKAAAQAQAQFAASRMLVMVEAAERVMVQ